MSSSPQTRIRYFRHGNIVKYCGRPYLNPSEQSRLENGDTKFTVSIDSIQRMNDALIANINKTVGVDDTLWHLGDFCFANKKVYYQKCKEFRERINCKNVNIIWGNHDHHEIADLFEENHTLTEIRVNGQHIVLCHYALAIWNKSHHGSWHLYGHSHAGAEEKLDNLFPGRKSMDVGVDNAYKVLGELRPFSFHELKQHMDSMDGHKVDNHH